MNQIPNRDNINYLDFENNIMDVKRAVCSKLKKYLIYNNYNDNIIEKFEYLFDTIKI